MSKRTRQEKTVTTHTYMSLFSLHSSLDQSNLKVLSSCHVETLTMERLLTQPLMARSRSSLQARQRLSFFRALPPFSSLFIEKGKENRRREWMAHDSRGERKKRQMTVDSRMNSLDKEGLTVYSRIIL